jgi:hydrogenase maturation protease
VFLGDDGFGVRLAERVGARDGVDVVDFGIRGMDLAYALAGYDVVVFLDATPRGGAPGTLYVIEPELDGLPLDVDAHAMDPVKVLALAKALGGELPRTLVLGCEPAAAEEFTELSQPVEAALAEAERLLDRLLEDVLTRKET